MEHKNTAEIDKSIPKSEWYNWVILHDHADLYRASIVAKFNTKTPKVSSINHIILQICTLVRFSNSLI